MKRVWLLLLLVPCQALAVPKAYEMVEYTAKQDGAVFVFDYASGYTEASTAHRVEKGKKTRFSTYWMGETETSVDTKNNRLLLEDKTHTQYVIVDGLDQLESGDINEPLPATLKAVYRVGDKDYPLVFTKQKK